MRSRLLTNLYQNKKLFHDYCKPCKHYVGTYFQLRQTKQFSTNNPKSFDDGENEETQTHNLVGSIGITHKVFADQDAEIILDIDEKQQTIDLEDLRIEQQHDDPYEGINLERGKSGVFDIEDLVMLLRKDNAKDIFVASVPPQLSYVDYLVVVTSKSRKHMKALAAFIRKVYKLKKHETDQVPKAEGEDSSNWVALDLGNIALHIFSHSTRVLYDLETLWAVGPDYDDKSRTTGDDIMDQYNAFLSDLEPMENNEKDRKMKKVYNQ